MRFRYGDVEFGRNPNGRQGPLIVTSFDPAGAEVSSQDHARLGRDGVVPGRDFLGAATWAIELSTNAARADEARAIYSELQRTWHDPATRGAAGELVALDYEVRGTDEWRRVYGRPRAFDPASGNQFMFQGRADFGVEFEVLDPRFYSGHDAGLYERTLTHASELAGGVYAPFTAPLSSIGLAGDREGALTNSGTIDTPVHVRFTGPVRNPLLRGSNGWHIGWNGSLRWDESVVVDPVRHAVIKYDGDGRPTSGFSGLTRRSQLSRLAIPPGLTNVFFSGVDDTHSSTAVIQWRDAYQSF